MKTIAKWILESIAATVVIIVCMAPQIGGLPSWTLGLSFIPIMRYLSWRLDGRAVDWRRVTAFAAMLSALILILELLPKSWRSWSFYLVPGIAIPFGSLLLRPKQKGALSARPGP